MEGLTQTPLENALPRGLRLSLRARPQDALKSSLATYLGVPSSYLPLATHYFLLAAHQDALKSSLATYVGVPSSYVSLAVTAASVNVVVSVSS